MRGAGKVSRIQNNTKLIEVPAIQGGWQNVKLPLLSSTDCFSSFIPPFGISALAIHVMMSYRSPPPCVTTTQKGMEGKERGMGREDSSHYSYFNLVHERCFIKCKIKNITAEATSGELPALNITLIQQICCEL